MDGWTTKRVCRQLSRWELEEYAESARRAKIDGPAMMALHEVDALCSQLGIVKKGHRKRLAIAIRHLDDDDNLKRGHTRVPRMWLRVLRVLENMPPRTGVVIEVPDRCCGVCGVSMPPGVVDKTDPALCFGCASSIKRKDCARRIEICRKLLQKSQTKSN
jgi:hypothetical protein